MIKTILCICSLVSILLSQNCSQTGQTDNPKKNNKGNTQQPKNNGEIIINKTPIINTADPRGIYVATEWQRPVPDHVFQNKDVDGIFLRLKWSPFNPAKGKYDFSFLNGELDKIVAAGKKFSIGITAGSETPEWVYTQGCKKLRFVEIPLQGKAEKAVEADIPVVWDPVFLQSWNEFVDALATNLKSNPKYYNALTIVKMTGINFHTAEIRLPAQREITNGKAKSTDAVKLWQSVGYKPSRVLTAWNSIVDNYNKNFPDKYLSYAMIPERGFPLIDENGQAYTKGENEDFTPSLIEAARKKIGNHFCVQFNALNEKRGTVPYVREAAKTGIVCGYQLEQVKLNNPPCLQNNSPCDEDMFKAVLDNGINNGGMFIEIFTKNVLAYPKAIKHGHDRIFSL